MVTWLHGTHMVQNFGFEKWILAGQTVAQCARTPILHLLSPKEYSCEIISNLTSGFGGKKNRISSCPYSAKSPHSPEIYF